MVDRRPSARPLVSSLCSCSITRSAVSECFEINNFGCFKFRETVHFQWLYSKESAVAEVKFVCCEYLRIKLNHYGFQNSRFQRSTGWKPHTTESKYLKILLIYQFADVPYFVARCVLLLWRDERINTSKKPPRDAVTYVSIIPRNIGALAFQFAHLRWSYINK